MLKRDAMDDRLRDVSIFSELSKKELKSVSRLMTQLSVKEGRELTRQGEPGDELYLVLDGVLDVEVDEAVVAEIGPGAIVGERAILEGGARTSTVRASTAAKVAAVSAQAVAPDSLADIASGHHREEV